MSSIEIPFHVGPSCYGFVTVRTDSRFERADGTVHPDHRDRVLKGAIRALETHREEEARWIIPERDEK